MPNGPANDHLTRGGISVSSARATVPGKANAAASASTQILAVALIACSPVASAASSFRYRGAARDRRPGRPALDRFADRVGKRLRPFDQAEQRQNDEEMEEIPSGKDARGQHVIAFRGLRAQPTETDAHRG